MLLSLKKWNSISKIIFFSEDYINYVFRQELKKYVDEKIDEIKDEVHQTLRNGDTDIGERTRSLSGRRTTKRFTQSGVPLSIDMEVNYLLWSLSLM